MTVRSRRLFGPVGNGTASAWHTLYTVPAGRTARFTVVTAVNTDTSARLVRVGVKASGIDNYVWYESFPAGASRLLLQGLVLNPADELEVYVDGTNTVQFAGFGSLLLGAPS